MAQALVLAIEASTRGGRPPSLEKLCRYLLVADTYAVKVRRNSSCRTTTMRTALVTVQQPYI